MERKIDEGPLDGLVPAEFSVEVGTRLAEPEPGDDDRLEPLILNLPV